MVPGHFLEAALQIISHQLDIVQKNSRFFHVGLPGKIGIPASRNGQHISSADSVQPFSHRLQKQRKIFLILHMGADSRQGHSRILPVNIYTVQPVFRHQRCSARRHAFPALCRQRRLGKTIRAPAACGKQDFNTGFYLPDTLQRRPAGLPVPNHASVPYLPKGNIDYIQAPDIFLRYDGKIPCAHIAD